HRLPRSKVGLINTIPLNKRCPGGVQNIIIAGADGAGCDVHCGGTGCFVKNIIGQNRSLGIAIVNKSLSAPFTVNTVVINLGVLIVNHVNGAAVTPETEKIIGNCNTMGKVGGMVVIDI